MDRLLEDLVRLADRISKVSVRATDTHDRWRSGFVTNLGARIDDNGWQMLEEEVNIRTASGSTQRLQKIKTVENDNALKP